MDSLKEAMLCKMLDVITEEDRLCDVCRFRGSCRGRGAHQTPSGPAYPICADKEPDVWLDASLVVPVYNEIMEG